MSGFILRSTRSELGRTKSAPNRRRDTSAMTKSHLYCLMWNVMWWCFFRIFEMCYMYHWQQIMNGSPRLCGTHSHSCTEKTLNSTPASTKNQHPEILSHTKTRPSMWPDAMTPTHVQPARFPNIHMPAGIWEPSHQTYGWNSKGWLLQRAVSFWALVVFVDAAGWHQ